MGRNFFQNERQPTFPPLGAQNLGERGALEKLTTCIFHHVVRVEPEHSKTTAHSVSAPAFAAVLRCVSVSS